MSTPDDFSKEKIAAIPEAGPLANDLLDRVLEATKVDNKTVSITVSQARRIIKALSAAENLYKPFEPLDMTDEALLALCAQHKSDWYSKEFLWAFWQKDLLTMLRKLAEGQQPSETRAHRCQCGHPESMHQQGECQICKGCKRFQLNTEDLVQNKFSTRTLGGCPNCSQPIGGLHLAGCESARPASNTKVGCKNFQMRGGEFCGNCGYHITEHNL